MFYTRPCMQSTWKPWAAAGLSAGLLELPFPLAGPMPPWRSVFAWFALVPLLWALLGNPQSGERRPLRRGFFVAYLCGVPVVPGQLLLDPRHHVALRRHADTRANAAAHRLQPGAGTLFRTLRPWPCAGAARHWLHAHGARLCAISLDGSRACRRAHHQRALGPAWLLAGG